MSVCCDGSDVLFIRGCSAELLEINKNSSSSQDKKLEQVEYRAQTANGSADSIGGNTTTLANNNATNRYYKSPQQIVHNMNVLCNSRCNCVILEPLAGDPASRSDQRSANASSAPSGGQKAASNGSSNELEFVAFSEDYSLDYEQPLDFAGPPDSDTPHSNETDAQSGPQNASGNASRPAPSGKRQEGMTLFPLPDNPHLQHHHRHQLPLSAGRESNGPQLYAQSLYSSQAPKLSYHAHTPYLKSDPSGSGMASQLSEGAHHSRLGHHHSRNQMQQQNGGRANSMNVGAQSTQQQQQQQQTNVFQKRALLPLKTLQMNSKFQLNESSLIKTNGSQASEWNDFPNLVQTIESMLIHIDQENIQSLNLRHNAIQFELWTELYALLAVQMRLHLIHLDLSHNSLPKLGITFTGYIEHHIAAHGSWPSNSNTQMNQSNEIFLATNKNMNAKASRLSKHSLFSGGRLYNLVQKRLVQKQSTLNGTINYISINNVSNNSSQFLQQPMQIRALDLSHNKLKWLIKDQFRALKHVQTIRLDYNRIRYIHQHAFSGLESLRFLNLNFNRLQVIYIEQFQTNYNLLALMLRSNYLTYLRGGSFASLANLKRLDLSQNKLTILSNNAFIGLESLELLNCSSNQFVHAPSASLHPLTSLRKLDLSDNLIAQLTPGTFFHLPIEELWLNQNEQMVAIDRGAFWDLPYLRQLSLKNNPMLQSINSQAFVGTQSLRTIDVDNCQSLESSSLKVLNNITMAANSRHLRLEQARNTANTAQSVQSQGSQTLLVTESSSVVIKKSPLIKSNSTSNITTATDSQADSQMLEEANKNLPKGQPINQVSNMHQSNRLKYVYYLICVSSLAIILKLVFHYTSASHYLAARRRRRRVYETKADADFGPDEGQSISSNSAAFTMYEHSSGLAPRPLGVASRSDAGSYSISELDSQSLGSSEAACDQGEKESVGRNDISVISEGPCCSDCPLRGVSEQDQAVNEDAAQVEQCCDSGQQREAGRDERLPQPIPLDLIHSQLIAAGFDYGHANCAHFYQSLGPALQFADMTANFVNQMDYY